MTTTTHTHYQCDRCAITVTLTRAWAPDGWMDVRGTMWDKWGSSTGVQFHALLCPNCRSALDDWKDELKP